jgi:hypothetical protein
MREFVTAVEDAFDPEPDEGNTLVLDGEKLRYYRPTDGQLAIYFASTGRHSSDADRTAAVINFFIELFDKESQEHLVERLLDRTDPFGLPKIEEMLEALTEEWSGRPTRRSSGSTQSRTSGGRKSTARTRKSTSSGSPRTASSTASTAGV